MRTTVNLDDDVFRITRSLAEETNSSLGAVLSLLVRKGLAAEAAPHGDLGIPVFTVSEKAPLFGADQVSEAEDDL